MVQLPQENSIFTRTVRRAAGEDRLSHAVILTGRGDLTAAARFLAAAHVCEGTDRPCLRCRHCRKVLEGIHPDVIPVLDTEHKELTVEAVRALRKDVYIRPNEAPKKVYVLEHAELLNATGQNILLKLIEEGPEYACFLFLSPNPELLLETIRSRCETLRAPGEETEQANQDGQTLADLILTGAGPMESLPFLMSLEKKDRQEIALLLQAAKENLVAALPQRPDLLPVIDRLAPISAACEFNISAGHLSGWIAAVLS